MICKKREYYIGLFLLLVSIIFFYFSFINLALPPQMGWWNYYGWRLAEGDILYKDIFCYLPPYIPFMQLLLYKLLGMKLFAFQILGICFVLLGAVFVYDFFCNYYKYYYVAISVLVGVVIAAGFMPHLPFDNNPIMLFVLIIMSYSVAKIQKDKYLYTIVFGISVGCLLMIKQTMLVYVFLLAVGLPIIKSYPVKFKNLWIHICIALSSIIIAIFPAILYLVQNDIVGMAINEIFVSSAAKGYSSDIVTSLKMMIERYFSYGFSATNVFIAFALAEKYLYKKNTIKNYINVILINLIIFKVLRTLIVSVSLNIHIITYMVLFALFFGMLNAFLFRKYEKLNKCVSSINMTSFTCIILISCMVIGLMISLWPSNFWLNMYNLENGHFFFLLKRAFSEIAFYFTLLAIIHAVKNKQHAVYNEQIISFVYCVWCFQALILVGSGSLDEAFSMPTVAFLMVFLLRKELKIVQICILSLSLLILLTSILQKQILPYAWHGWQSIGLGDIKTEFMYSKINNLEGYKLDLNTENAYKNIVDAINIYTQKDDNVYEFPHITLFNCLTERKMGTFAVSHFIDVCPDAILLKDLEKIGSCTPEMFIYMKLDEGAWRINEEFYRNGRYSARKNIEKFYEDYIKKNYTFVYSYKNIYVWVKSTTNKQNLQYAISLLLNYANNYNKNILIEYMNTVNVEDYQYIVNDNTVWTVNDCIREILENNKIVYDNMGDDDYMHIIPDINHRVSGIPAMDASYLVKEE